MVVPESYGAELDGATTRAEPTSRADTKNNLDATSFEGSSSPLIAVEHLAVYDPRTALHEVNMSVALSFGARPFTCCESE